MSEHDVATTPSDQVPQRPFWRAVFRVWGRRLIAAVLMAVLVVGVIGLDRWYLSYSETPAVPEDLSLEAQWNKAIGRLGIEPVYPPQEDIAVGDLFAVAVSDNDAGRDPASVDRKIGPGSAFLSRAVKLGHVPVEKQLAAEYASLPAFVSPPEGGTPPPSARAAGAVAQPGPPRIFGQGNWDAFLPRAAFPGLTITYSGNATTGLSGGDRGWFGHSASRENVQKLEVRVVETYGLPSVVAAQALNDFCTVNMELCSEETARLQLTGVDGIGDRVLDKTRNPNSGKDYFPVAVKIFMISRVYTSREILEQSTVDTAEGISGKVTFTSSRQARTGRDTPSATSEAPANGAQKSPPETAAAMDKRLDEMDQKLASMQAGGVVAFRSDNGLEELLHEKFIRPIAIGFRSVKYTLRPSVDSTADKSGR
jgi:hypothetical protein